METRRAALGRWYILARYAGQALNIAAINFAFMISRLQFPVRLAFAISINKSQGQSVKYVGVDLRMPVLTHGQLYVALSRATSRRRVKILLPQRSAHNRTPNVVFPQIFQ